MRRATCAAATLFLMAAAFGAGRFAVGSRDPPAIAATLPGDDAQFSQEFDERIRDRFPSGAARTRWSTF
jgi:hypothetical protein